MQGELAKLLYHQHQRLAALWQLLNCHISGQLSWKQWKELFNIFMPDKSPEEVIINL